MNKYEGYKYCKDIILVERVSIDPECTAPQAYLVDATNKSQLAAAHRWADWEDRKWQPETRSYQTIATHPGIEHKFVNEGFTIKLCSAAGGSSQGGKLSFWNCLLTKDDKTFVIGINSDLLLECLLEGTFIKGECQERVCFYTRKNQVGICIVGGDIYNEVYAEVLKKQNIKSAMTCTYEFGDVVETFTGSEVYLGKMYRHYRIEDNRPFSMHRRYRIWNEDIPKKWYGVRVVKLRKPQQVFLYYHVSNDQIPHLSELVSDVGSRWINKQRNKVSRYVPGTKMNLDGCSENDFHHAMEYLYSSYNGILNSAHYFENSDLPETGHVIEDAIHSEFFGIGKQNFELSEMFVDKLREYGVVVEEEE